MDEKRAREVIEKCSLDGNLVRFNAYGDDAEHTQLDGEFTADELEAIAWWMRNKSEG